MDGKWGGELLEELGGGLGSDEEVSVLKKNFFGGKKRGGVIEELGGDVLEEGGDGDLVEGLWGDNER